MNVSSPKKYPSPSSAKGRLDTLPAEIYHLILAEVLQDEEAKYSQCAGVSRRIRAAVVGHARSTTDSFSASWQQAQKSPSGQVAALLHLAAPKARTAASFLRVSQPQTSRAMPTKAYGEDSRPFNAAIRELRALWPLRYTEDGAQRTIVLRQFCEKLQAHLKEHPRSTYALLGILFVETKEGFEAETVAAATKLPDLESLASTDSRTADLILQWMAEEIAEQMAFYEQWCLADRFSQFATRTNLKPKFAQDSAILTRALLLMRRGEYDEVMATLATMSIMDDEVNWCEIHWQVELNAYFLRGSVLLAQNRLRLAQEDFEYVLDFVEDYLHIPPAPNPAIEIMPSWNGLMYDQVEIWAEANCLLAELLVQQGRTLAAELRFSDVQACCRNYRKASHGLAKMTSQIMGNIS